MRLGPSTRRYPSASFRGRFVLAVVSNFLVAAAPAAAQDPARVLLFYSLSRHAAPFDAFGNILRAELVRQSPVALDIREASVDMASMKEGDGQDAFLVYLDAIFAAEPPDLLIAIGGTASDFVQSHRAALFPEVPLLLAGANQTRIETVPRTAKDVAVAFKVDIPAIAETVLSVEPDTKEILIVLGSSPLERFWREAASEDLRPFEDRIALRWTTGLRFEEILETVAALPPTTAVLYGLLLVDGAGVPLEGNRATAALTAASAVPVYGIYDSQLGEGVLGGRLLPVLDYASVAAETAVRLLGGAAPETVQVPAGELGPPTFDARQLARFGISQDRLPEGSRVLFREPSAWDRFRQQIILVAAALVVQSVLIAVLLASRRRLQLSRAALATSEERAQAAATSARGLARRLIRAQETERSRLGRELHDDITQRLAGLAIKTGQCERQASRAEEAASLAGVREGLAQLSSDVHALSYSLHPSIIEHLGLAAAVESEAERVADVEGLPVEVEIGALPDDLPAPIALCLFRVAQEALRNAVRHAHASQARVSVSQQGREIRLIVEDDGTGFAPEANAPRLSLGLDSMAERLAAFEGGTFRLDSAPGRGTRIEARIPLE